MTGPANTDDQAGNCECRAVRTGDEVVSLENGKADTAAAASLIA